MLRTCMHLLKESIITYREVIIDSKFKPDLKISIWNIIVNFIPIFGVPWVVFWKQEILIFALLPNLGLQTDPFVKNTNIHYDFHHACTFTYLLPVC